MNKNITLNNITSSPAIATAIILLIPLSAKLITEEMAWTLSDFIFMGLLIFCTGTTYTLITRLLAPRFGDNIIYRVAIGLSLFAGLFLIWSNLAVGIIGSEDNLINGLYYGVIFVGIIGAFMSRFKPKGMSLSLLAMALTQGIITLFAFIKGMTEVPESSVYELLAVNGFFITLFVLAALLFLYITQQEPPNAETQN